MSMGKLREREMTMALRTSSSVKVVGAWSEFAVVGMAILIMMLDLAVGGAARLELNVFGAGGALFFEEGGDDAGG